MGPLEQTIFAWAWMLMGLLSGVVLGLGFHKAEFMGGYAGWRRRLARLGHIAFFGTGLLNLFAAFTWIGFGLDASLMPWSALLLVVGAVSMPTVCFLCAWKKPLRHLFPIPVITLIGGSAMLFVALLQAPPMDLGEPVEPSPAVGYFVPGDTP